MSFNNNGNTTPIIIRNGTAQVPNDPYVPPENGTFGTQTDIAPPPVIITTPSGSFLTKFDWTDTSTLCPLGLDIRSINSVLFKVLATHFSSADSIFASSLKDNVFNDSPNSPLRIMMNSEFNIATGDRIPAIIIKRGPQKAIRLGINDLGDYSDGMLTSETLKFTRVIEGQHQIICISPTNGESEILGLEVYDTFNTISPLLRSKQLFMDFEVTDISELSVLEELGNRFGVMVTLAYKYELGWTITTQTPDLHTVSIQ
jgi:hypothetical protein